MTEIPEPSGGAGAGSAAGATPRLDAETAAAVRAIITSCVYGNLATVGADGVTPRVRPVCAFLQDDWTILVPSHAATRKVVEIRRNPRVEIVFVDERHWQVRVAGTAVVVGEEAEKRRLMETTLEERLWRGFFPGGERDERFILYRIVPESFEWMKEWELDYRRPR